MELNYRHRCCQLIRIDRRRNSEIRRGINVDILETMECKRFRWYGDVERMDNDRWSKRIIHWTPLHRRKRGRPRKRWNTEMKVALEIENRRLANGWTAGVGSWEDVYKRQVMRIITNFMIIKKLFDIKCYPIVNVLCSSVSRIWYLREGTGVESASYKTKKNK